MQREPSNRASSGEAPLLIHSPNWLGDVVMALPAFRAWRQATGGRAAYILAKASVAGLWNLVRDVAGIIVLHPESSGMRDAAAEIRATPCEEAVLLPNSFRSAWLVRRGGIRYARGTTGEFRSFLISDPVDLTDLEGAHQQCEYARLLAPADTIDPLPPPSDAIDTSRLPAAPDIGFDPANALVILPGAARGPSKRWPAEHYAAAAKLVLSRHPGLRVVVCGTPDEAGDCAALCAALGPTALNLAGKTKLFELASLIARARAVCCNDSGGMHLATAMGTPVVAIFGLTDPAKTGPLGRSRVVAAEGVRVSRSIPRESAAAARALASIDPHRVASALEEFLA